MSDFAIYIRDISDLKPTEVREICNRLSWPLEEALHDSMQPEVLRRHVNKEPGPHPPMTMALVYHNGYFASWVATRPFFEKFKGNLIPVQTIECFTDGELRNRGLAQLGLYALISAGYLDRRKPVSVYHKAVVTIAERCGCTCVILCDSRDEAEEAEDETLSD
jgi:hypothetical protein